MVSFVQKTARLARLLSKSAFSGTLNLSRGRRNVYYYSYTKQLCQPLKKKPKYVTAEEAFQCLKSGDLVFAQGAAATPQHLLKVMTDHGKTNNLKGITVCHMHTEGEAPYAKPENSEHFRSCSFFMGSNVRKGVAEGTSDCIPIFLSEIPKLFHRGIYKPDIALIHVSQPDNHGYCSLGTSVDCVRSALAYSKLIIAQVNPNMPRTFGDSLIHSSHIDFAVNVDTPLPEHGGKPPTEIESRIGKLIAENLVDNGATLQMGIGNIPDAVLASLTNHKDLGIHTEMFSAGVIDLMEKGCITNNMKPIHREMLEVDYTNSTFVISRMPKMTAINSCIEVDLTGQVVSDSIGTRMYSGFGGQVDFIRGASEALDGKGKPILAFPSSTKNISKIVPYLKEGAGVVTTRAHVGYLVTEYGIADLFGKTLRQRAYALIQIAHPDHREALEKAAFQRLKTMPVK